jgi:translation initiation factor 3 subunit I
VQLGGHKRPITVVMYNYDGDLIFTASKDSSMAAGDSNITLWLVETGERVGTYQGHSGAVTSLDITRDSRFLLSGSADGTVRVWEALTGAQVAVVNTDGNAPCQSVAWAEGEREFAVVTNKFSAYEPKVRVYGFDPNSPPGSMVGPSRFEFSIVGERETECNYTKCAWMPMNDSLLLSMEHGVLRQVDLATREVKEWSEHSKYITSISFNSTKTLLLTTSKDATAVLWDVEQMEVRNRYTTDVPINAGALSNFKEHIILGGGIEARDAATQGREGGFEVRFFDLVHAKELGRVKGHFSPINAVAFSPDGWGFCSGAEEANARLYKLDTDYLKLGEEDNLDDPALTTAMEDGTFESLEKEEEEEFAKGKATGEAVVGGGGGK